MNKNPGSGGSRGNEKDEMSLNSESVKHRKRKPYRGTQAVMRAIKILSAFTDEQPEWSLADLSKDVDLNRTTLYRMMTALESARLITRDPNKDTYRLGSELIVLGWRAMRANPLREIARPELLKLAELTHETVSLEILDGIDTVMLDEVKSAYMIGMVSSIGKRWPAYASSTGKVLLGYLPPESLSNHLPEQLKPLTEKTIIDRSAFIAGLEEVRQKGFASAWDELEMGYSDISAPVFNHEGKVVAAISLGGATPRFTEEIVKKMVAWLKESTAQVSYLSGYRKED